MPSARLPIELENFPKKRQSSHVIQVRRFELVHAAITTGVGLSPFGSSRPFSLNELAWKLPIVDALLTADSGQWARRIDSDWLDPSEKNALAYFLSNIQTGLVATRLFGATHIAHLSKLDSHSYTRASGHGRRLPDFAGINVANRDSFVIESKGSFNRVSARAISQASLQLDTAIAFRGYPRPMRYAHASQFSGKKWEARLIRHSGPSRNVRAVPGSLLYLYYLPIVRLIESAKPSTRSGFLTASIGEYKIGLHEELVAAVRSTMLTGPDVFALGSGPSRLASRFEELESVATEIALGFDTSRDNQVTGLAFADGMVISEVD